MECIQNKCDNYEKIIVKTEYDKCVDEAVMKFAQEEERIAIEKKKIQDLSIERRKKNDP